MKKHVKKLVSIVMATSMFISFNTVVYAAATATATGAPDIITKLLKLLNDAAGWLVPLIIGATVVMVGYFSFQKSASDDQAQTAELNKKIKSTIIAGSIGVGSSSLVYFILTYFM